MPHTTDLVTIGDTIYSLGKSWAAGEITLAVAVARLRAADPTLTEQGATGQIRAWQTAPSRYQAAARPEPTFAARPNPRDLGKQPIVFRFG